MKPTISLHEARLAGRTAAKDVESGRLDKAINPYNIGDPRHDAWRLGYAQASKGNR